MAMLATPRSSHQVLCPDAHGLQGGCQSQVGSYRLPPFHLVFGRQRDSDEQGLASTDHRG